MKRMVVMMIILALFGGITVQAETSGEALKDYGIVSGDANGNLNEDDKLTRAELATLLCRLNDVDDEAKNFKQSGGFKDVSETAWYSGYVNYAKSKGWMNGTATDIFAPNVYVSEEMVATVMLRLLGYSPAWGNGVSIADGIGMYVRSYNNGDMLRSDVFNYIKSILIMKIDGTNQYYYEKIGLDIDVLNELIMWIRDSNGDFITYDINMQIIEEEKSDLEIEYDSETYSNKIIYMDKEYGPFSKLLGYYYNNYVIEGHRVYYNSDETIVILENETFFYRNFKLESQQDYKYADENIGIVYNPDEQDYYGFSDYSMFDKNGSLLMEGFDSRIISLGSNKIGVLGKDGTGFIYDTLKHSKVLEFDNVEWIVFGDSQRIVFIYNEDKKESDMGIYNFTTSTYKNLKLDPEDQYLGASWDQYNNLCIIHSYTDDMYEVTRQSYVIDPVKGVLLKTMKNINTAMDIESQIPVYETRSNDNKYGLININGLTILPEEYNRSFYADIFGNEQYFGNEDEEGNSIYFNMSGKVVENSSLLLSKEMLPTGEYIYHFYEKNDANTACYNSAGEKILSGASYYSFLHGFNLILANEDGNRRLYDLQGKPYSLGTDYESYYSIANRYIGAMLNGKTYILEEDGTIVKGPIEGNAYIYWE